MPAEFRILLTGGAGFIGSHVAEGLLRAGASLTIVDCLDSFYPPPWKLHNLEEIRRVGPFELAQQDVCDREGLREVFHRARPNAVVHLAARAGVRPSIEQPLLYERVNINGTLNLLELCRELHVEKFVFASSSSVYGATSRAPFSDERTELRPISPYAATKLSGELLCYTYAHLFGMAINCLRFFTVYGPRQRPDLAIHKFTALIEKGLPIPLFGDGSSGRDYTEIRDIVAGVLAAVSYEPNDVAGVRFEVLNLGNSHPVKLNDLVNLLEAATGKEAIRAYGPPQPGDVPLTWASIDKATRLLGYRPAIPIEEGLRRFVDWYRNTEPALRA